jgi:hypothetical protein
VEDGLNSANFNSGMNRDRSADSLSSALDKFASDLERQFQEAEGEFIKMGSQLQDFRERSREISEKATGIIGRMTGEELSLAIDNLNRLVKAGAPEKGSIFGAAGLSNILDRFKEIGPPLRSLVKIVKYLDVICVIMKIENARFQSTETGFSTVAQGLKELGNTIRIKSEDLGARSQSMVLSIRQSMNSVQKKEIIESDQARLILTRAVESIKPLQEKRSAASAAVNDIASRYESISRSIGKVVSGLQFHDITRQRIDHYAQAIREIGASLSGSRDDDWNRKLASSAEIGRLQTAQLRHIKQDLLQAVSGMKSGLRNLVQEVKEISLETGRLTGSAFQAGESFWGEIKKSLVFLQGAAAEYSQIHGEISTTISSVGGIVDDISNFAQEIKQIGTRMQIIAMNASVNASRIGAEGMSLGVLAQETQDLAGETVAQISAISEVLKSAIASAHELSDQHLGSMANRPEKTMTMDREFEEMESRMQAADVFVAEALREMKEFSAALSTDVESAVASFQSPEAFAESMDCACERLESFVNQIRQMLPLESRGTVADMDELTARYTMNRERTVHQSVLGLAGESDSVNRSEKLSISQNELEFGENVELF